MLLYGVYVRCWRGIGTGHVKGDDCVYVRTPCHAMPIKVSRQDGEGCAFTLMDR